MKDVALRACSKPCKEQHAAEQTLLLQVLMTTCGFLTAYTTCMLSSAVLSGYAQAISCACGQLRDDVSLSMDQTHVLRATVDPCLTLMM